MATTNVQPLRSVRARMEYTALGRGDARARHLSHGTNRIAGRCGDFASREAFAIYCAAVTAQHGRRVEGFELRVSWDDMELDPQKSENIELALGHSYELARRIAPNSPCDVTAHTDGEGGKLHTHIAIANVDEATGRALSHGMNHRRISMLNDELSREEGLTITGEKSRSWAAKRERADAFERALGNAVTEAKAASASMDDFRRELGLRGIELRERTTKDKSGREVIGWSYHMDFDDGRRKRKRRRSASRLAGEFAPQAMGRYFRAIQRQQQAAPMPPIAALATKEEASNDASEEKDDALAAWRESEGFEVDEGMAAQALDELASARSRQLRSRGAGIGSDALHTQLAKAREDPADAAAHLNAEMEAARAAFRKAKEFEAQAAQLRTAYGCLSLVLGIVGRSSRNPVVRIFSAYLGEWAKEADKQARAELLADAKAQTYEARGAMWDVEKRARAAEKALAATKRHDARTNYLMEKGKHYEQQIKHQRQRERDLQLGG